MNINEDDLHEIMFHLNEVDHEAAEMRRHLKLLREARRRLVTALEQAGWPPKASVVTVGLDDDFLLDDSGRSV